MQDIKKSGLKMGQDFTILKYGSRHENMKVNNTNVSEF